MAGKGPGVWLVAVTALVAGGMVGAGGAALRTRLTPWQIGDLMPLATAISSDAPRVEIPETTHAFGSIGTGDIGSHRFEVRNVGGGPLTLRRGSSSCTCTVSDFDGAEGDDAATTREVAAGAATEVTVQWKGKPPGGPFRQQVTILTDDPRRPEIVFVVEGTVIPTWQAVPSLMALPRITASATERASTTVYTYGDAEPSVRQIAIDHPQAAQFFSLVTTPLLAEEIAAETNATGGFRIDVDIKPGLPLGPLRQMVTATFTMPQQVTAEIPLEATVGGDLVLAGPGWDSSQQALRLGTVSGRKGFRTRLFLTAKGPHRDQVQPRVVEAVPDVMEVTVGKGTPIGSGAVVRIPIDIVIPVGSRTANHLCSKQAPAGRIVLDTGHPDSPSLSIPICVAIGP
jgi:hypothetical protein